MKHQTILFTILLSMYFISTFDLISETLASSPVDHSIYAELLKKYVNDGRVDYAGLKTEETKLDAYLGVLKEVDSKRLARDEQFAFYANAYNAWTIRLILTKYPDIKSFRELGFLNSGPWKKKVVQLKNEAVSLDHIEHDVLRPRFKDPRVHFAINCAAKSCPPLRPEPFRADILNQQLEDATRSFLNNPTSYKLEGNTLYVSKIFKWFAEDFNADVLGFYLKYAKADLRQKLEANRSEIIIKYMNYDWGLNGE